MIDNTTNTTTTTAAVPVEMENSSDSMNNKPELIDEKTTTTVTTIDAEAEVNTEAAEAENASVETEKTEAAGAAKEIEEEKTPVVDEKSEAIDGDEKEPAVDASNCCEKTLKEIDALLKASKLDEAVELYGTFMEIRIKQVGGNGADPCLAEDYARYGSLLLKLAIRNNDQNLLNSGSTAAEVNEASAAALLVQETAGSSGKKKKLIELGDDDDDDVQETTTEEGGQVEAILEEAEGFDEEPTLEAFDEAEAEIAAGDDDDFTIAWENLDVARLLFERRLDGCSDAERPELMTKLARVLQDLGDLCLEDENFKQAVVDYQAALKAYGTPQAHTLREIAGIYFNSALALEFVDAVGEAKKMYAEAQKLLQQRRDLVDEADPEAAELDGLIGEIGLKMQDMDSGNGQAALSAQMSSATSQAALSAAQSLSGAVNDLSGMIKKRKASTPASTEESATKQSKQE